MAMLPGSVSTHSTRWRRGRSIRRGLYLVLGPAFGAAVEAPDLDDGERSARLPFEALDRDPSGLNREEVERVGFAACACGRSRPRFDDDRGAAADVVPLGRVSRVAQMTMA